MIVLDASAAIDGLLDAAGHAPIAACLAGGTEPLAAPDLLDVEVLSVMRRWCRHDALTAPRAQQLLDDLVSLPVVRYPGRALTDRAWALRDTLTAYDAQYVALAQELSAPLLTTDLRMARAAANSGIDVYPIDEHDDDRHVG